MLMMFFCQIRIIFRLIEFSSGAGSNNTLIYHEWPIYSLDALPMFLAILLLAIWHPGRFLVGPESHFPKLTRKEKKMMKAEKKEAKRQKKEQKKMEKEAKKNRTFVDQGGYSMDDRTGILPLGSRGGSADDRV
jgi:hypothetical protein